MNITDFIAGGYKDMLGKPKTPWDRLMEKMEDISAEDYERETGLKYDMVDDEITGYPDPFISEEEEVINE